MKFKIIVIASSFVVGSVSIADAQTGPFVELRAQGEGRHAVTGPTLAMRVGNGVLLRSFSWTPGQDYAISGRLLASCRGHWLSDSFDIDLHETGGTWTPTAWQKEALAREVSFQSSAIELKGWSASDLTIALPLRAKIDAICKSAVTEPRNVFLSISNSVQNKEGVIRVSAIVTGTAIRKEALVEVWLRSSEFLLETIKVNNEPLVIDGIEQKRRTANGNYEMLRSVFDCKNRRLGTYQVVRYKSDGTNTSDSIDRSNLHLKDAIPNTVGEAELDAVCMLYGPVNQ